MIPGMGTDELLFSRLSLNADVKVIRWEFIDKNESMEGYAKKLSQQIDKSKPFYLLGVSLGGMLALEISAILNPLKTILVSGAKNRNELPFRVKLMRLLPFHKAFSNEAMVRIAVAGRRKFGVSKGDGELFHRMMQGCPPHYFSRAAELIVKWNRIESPPGSLIHIHCMEDRIIPFRNIKDAIPIEKGGHFMIMNYPDDLSRLINSHLCPG
jgi:pimeloyl-ACP methyl ester carboxylesterase